MDSGEGMGMGDASSRLASTRLTKLLVTASADSQKAQHKMMKKPSESECNQINQANSGVYKSAFPNIWREIKPDKSQQAGDTL